ncbi:hypothetical protein [Bradyrhizobium paxllaeri]|uniref:hypothetical protein n=1 Tax=Bradyrhizobium paxllaeri TaxID=190148 RepID=UPI001146A031|nr:hypothetical protein [Bradyrhizobium paxllaeri]
MRDQLGKETPNKYRGLGAANIRLLQAVFRLKLNEVVSIKMFYMNALPPVHVVRDCASVQYAKCHGAR